MCRRELHVHKPYVLANGGIGAQTHNQISLCQQRFGTDLVCSPNLLQK